MNMEDMILLSIDDHIIEPPDMFDQHMPAKYRGEAPVYVEDAGQGKGAWLFQGKETGHSGLGSVASWPHDEWGMDATSFAEMRPAVYDVNLRVRDMDANGQLTAMCFPTFAGFNGMSLARANVDRDLTTAVISAYNDWHIDELAGEHPGRFLPMGILPVYEPDAMVAEIRRIAAKGVTAVTLPETPYGVGLPAFGEDTYWDPVFAALSELDIVMCLHIGGAYNLFQRPRDQNWTDLVLLVGQLSAIAATDLMLSGTFRKFPDLKVAMSEGGIGWVGFMLDRMDRYMENQTWADLRVGTGDMTPSDVWRRNFLGCFITDPTALATRHRIGIENIAWECDYPHSDSSWPFSPETLHAELTAVGCTDDEINAITWENAARFFRFDPFRVVAKDQATVGALRSTAADVDVSEVSKAEYRRRWNDSHLAV